LKDVQPNTRQAIRSNRTALTIAFILPPHVHIYSTNIQFLVILKLR
jgi:hypothetical protein